MNQNEAIAIINAAMQSQLGRQMSDIETIIFEGAWADKTYTQIAEEAGYSVNYLTTDIGPKFWKVLSQALGESVTKKNFKAAIQRCEVLPVHSFQASHSSPYENPAQPNLDSTRLSTSSNVEGQNISSLDDSLTNRLIVEWGEMPDVSQFKERTTELNMLSQWVEQDNCRLVAILGMGGVGKSLLAAKFAQSMTEAMTTSLTHSSPIEEPSPRGVILPPQSDGKITPLGFGERGQFTHLIWCSLRNAPPLEGLLSELVLFLSNQSDTQADVRQLLHWFRVHRCLVILDNVESILQPGDRTGSYRPGYENYGDLFSILGESIHQSCLLLTGREKLAEVAAMEGMDLGVRSLSLSGCWQVGKAILTAKGLLGTDAQKQMLCDRYSGNPLALKIVASSIQDLFAGEIEPFLQQDTILFNGIRRLLDQQFDRLSYLEQSILYWLAINREWTGIATLEADILPSVSRVGLLEALESLSWRNLIEKRPGYYTLQPVVMEYVCDRLIEQITTELVTQRLLFFDRHALLKTTVRDHLRESQSRLIVQPILQALQDIDRSTSAIAQRFQEILSILHTDASLQSGYAAGNLLNLCCHLGLDLSPYNFSHLTIRHADLQNRALQGVNFSHATFADSIFTKSLSPVFTVAFSPDGALLAVGEGKGQTQIWRLSDRQSILTLPELTHWVHTVAFSPDGSLLASCGSGQIIRIWDVQTGTAVRQFTSPAKTVWSLCFHPTEHWLATSGDTTLLLWNLSTGERLHTFTGHTDEIRSIDFSRDGRLLVSGSLDGTAILWNTVTRQIIRVFNAPRAILSIHLSPDSALLATGQDDGTIGVWNVATGEQLAILRSHTQPVLSVRFSPDGTLLASGSADGTARLWQVSTRKPLKTLQGHTNWLWSVRFSPDGTVLAVGCNDQTVKLWDVATGHMLTALQGYASWVMSLHFSPDSRWLASGNFDCTIRLWDVAQQRLWKTLRGHQSWVETVRFSPDGQRLASGSTDRTIKLWDVQTGRVLNTLTGHLSTIWSVSFSPDGRWLASGSLDNTIKLWDARSGELLKTLQGHTNWIWTVEFSPDSTLLASGSADGTIKLWEVQTGRLWKTLPGETGWIWSVSFSPDGRQLAAGSNGGLVQVWDLETATVLYAIADHTAAIQSIQFHPFKALLASGSYDQTIGIWNSTTGRSVQRLHGHQNRIAAIAFSPDGQWLASGSIDETIRLWDLESGNCEGILRPDRPYEGMNIADVRGLTEAQKAILNALGAIEST